MNKNEFAKLVTLREKKKVQVNIAQIKEILSIVFDELRKMEDVEIIKFIKGKRKSREAK